MDAFTLHYFFFCATRFCRRRAGLGAWLLAVSLLFNTIAPTWAIQKDSDAMSGKNVSSPGESYGLIRSADLFLSAPVSSPTPPGDSEILRAIEAYPEVVVFPIQVAGPVVAVAPHRNIVNKVAQAFGGGSIAVIYPDIGEPYRSVFAQIVNGIEDKAKGHIANFAVGKNVNVDELNNSLRRQDTRVVIALGQQGVKVASSLDSNIGVIVGGVLGAPEKAMRNLEVNSLSPDPALLFSRLKGLMPKVRRVFTVYDSRQNDWMMRLAKDAARAQGLELVTYEAQDLRSAMSAYKQILATADGSRDALWLPQDSTTVEDSVVLPMVLQESWSRSLAVFSSSFGHVRRGVLFSLYPDNVGLGRHLADSASGFASGENGNTDSGIVPLREVLMAVNLRTAKHLGLNTSHQRNFDIAFPEQ